METLKKKYLIIGGLGVLFVLAGQVIGDNIAGNLISGAGLYFLAWGLFGDILSNVTIVKREATNITTQNLTIEKAEINSKDKNNA